MRVLFSTVGFLTGLVWAGVEGQSLPAADEKTPLPESTEERLPPPSPESLTPIREKIWNEFPLPRSPTVRAKADLAKKLLVLAREEADPVRQYVLLQRAMELACEAGEARILMKSMEVLTDQFDLAPVPLALETLAKCIPNLKEPRQATEWAESVEHLIEKALAAEDFQAASSLGALWTTAATRPAGQIFRNQARKRQSYLEELARLAEQFHTSEAALAKSPDDPQANLTVGRWYCFVQENWERGLPLLAKGSDASLRTVAQRELAGDVASPTAMVQLGHQWWEAANREGSATQPGAFRRAAFWYLQALKNPLPEKLRQMVELRLGKLEDLPPPIPKKALRSSTTVYYVSARHGDDSNPGTRRKAWKTLEQAFRKIQPGDTVVIFPGLYRQERFDFRPPGTDGQHRTVFRFAWDDHWSGRAVLTRPDDEAPDFSLAPYTRLEGLWIGGRLPADPKSCRHGFTNREGIQMVGCTVWAHQRGRDEHMYGLLCGNTAVNMLLKDCLFVHLGGHWFGHAIYVSGGPPPTTQDCRLVGNVFLQGGGFAIHCWHTPKNITIVGNFISGHTCGLVAQGPGHVLHHNVIWKPVGKPDDPKMNICAMLSDDPIRFDHHVLFSTRPIDGKGKPQQPPIHNYSLTGQHGTQVNLIPLLPSQLVRLPWVAQSPQAIETAIQRLDQYFSTNSPEQIAQDTGDLVENGLQVLRVKYQPSEADLASRPVKE